MRRIIFLAVAVLMLGAMAWADSVTTKEGKTLEGKVIVNGDTVTVKTDKALYQFNKSDLSKINVSGTTTELNKEETPVTAGTQNYDELLKKVEESGKPEIAGEEESPIAVIMTDKGNIFIELNEDKAPNTTANFISLAQKKFYDGLVFHRVVPKFVIQGGDPEGTGRGGPGYRIKAEITDLKHIAGAVATARLGDEVNPERESSGSQFYICLEPTPHLDGGYTIFGQTVQGMDVVLKIVQGDKMNKILILKLRNHEYKPYTIKEK